MVGGVREEGRTMDEHQRTPRRRLVAIGAAAVAALAIAVPAVAATGGGDDGGGSGQGATTTAPAPGETTPRQDRGAPPGPRDGRDCPGHRDGGANRGQNERDGASGGESGSGSVDTALLS